MLSTIPSLSKSHSHAVIPSREVEVSVNLIVKGSGPLVGVAEKSAVGRLRGAAEAEVIINKLGIVDNKKIHVQIRRNVFLSVTPNHTRVPVFTFSLLSQ